MLFKCVLSKCFERVKDIKLKWNYDSKEHHWGYRVTVNNFQVK